MRSVLLAVLWLELFLSAVRAESPRRLLLVDDHHILYRAGTRREFHPAQLNPSNPVVREDQPWEMAIGWSSIHRDVETGRYQLWYQAYAGGRDERRTHTCVVCYAESSDGVRFSKPKLAIHDFKTARAPWSGEYRDTNIVLVGSGGYGHRYGSSVLYDSAERDPARRYKMLYTDFGMDAEGREWPGFFAAFSPDGIHWTGAPQNPLLRTAYGGRSLQPPLDGEPPYSERWDAGKNFLRKAWPIPLSMSDAVDVLFDPLRQKYVAYGKCWLNGPDGGLAWKHAMARVESQNFLDWSPPQIVCTPDDLDPPNIEFHTSPVFFYGGCYFCLNQILRARGETVGGKADLMHVELMTSRDGIRWERPFRDTPFFPSQSQAFSSGGIFTNATPVVLDDEIRFYYGGYTSGAIGGGSQLDADAQQSGVGLASIPLDRFAGIRTVERSAQATLRRPLEHAGQITLQPLDLSGVGKILVNADATDGEVRVEVLTAEGYRVPGFTRDEAGLLTGDSLRHEATWQDRRLSDLPAGRYLLRVHLRHAEVFSLVLEDR